MASRNSAEVKNGPNITEAADRTGSLIRDLESRLRARSTVTVAPPPEPSP